MANTPIPHTVAVNPTLIKPNPAVVAQAGVQRLPRWALLLFCVGFILPGWFGREPWKGMDMDAFGFMLAIARGDSPWWQPSFAGLVPDAGGVLHIWLGAASIKLGQFVTFGLLPADFAVRIPFAVALALALAGTWYACYHFSRHASAQPVSFAFGGEADPVDYARTLGDGAVLALIASLGVAFLAHQTAQPVLQLCAISWMLCATAAMAHRPGWPYVVWAGSGLMLAASGAAYTALVAVAVLGLVTWPQLRGAQRWKWAGSTLMILLGVAAMSISHNVLRQDVNWPDEFNEFRRVFKLWSWFAWPTVLFAAYGLWRWREHWRAPHLSAPAALALAGAAMSFASGQADVTLLVSLPALAVLTAFALPTVKQGALAVVDWFSLIFFSGCALVVWVVYVAMHTGVPAKPAANVERLAPGFEAQFGWVALIFAVLATLAWAWLVRWRVGVYRHPLWKSMVLPAGGVIVGWLLLMTLWMPLLDYARSYEKLAQLVQKELIQPGCVQVKQSRKGQAAGLYFYTDRRLMPYSTAPQCPYLVMDAGAPDLNKPALAQQGWTLQAKLRRPSSEDEDFLIFARAP
jgi:hypothetical protein